MKEYTSQHRLAFLLTAIVVVILGSSASAFAQDNLEKDYRGFPVKLSSLVEALKSGKFQENEIITIVNENGVSFPLTSDNEKKLRIAGANSELIAAVRQKFFSSLGVVNGRAANLIAPTFPAAARDAHAGGSVNVAVTIDADGNVLTAHAVSGDSLLRKAAEEAARASTFSPTVLAGKKIQVSGIIVYNFIAQ